MAGQHENVKSLFSKSESEYDTMNKNCDEDDVAFDASEDTDITNLNDYNEEK